ncbi:EAL domain-containing protein [Vibrio mimicus]|nr:EAL domain-containing protein [Vibrio mimicus]QXC58718.1 EAL domain-containing protein [Vibrio mimicus]
MVISSRAEFNAHLYQDDEDLWCAKYRGLELSSVYQPIFAQSGEILGVEALLRIKNTQTQTPIAPNIVLDINHHSIEECINLDRLSRVIHIRNFAQSTFTNYQLFLNILPVASEYNMAQAYPSLLLVERIRELGLEPEQVVLEITESDSANEELLRQAGEYIKKSGFQIAIDDYGSFASDIRRVDLIHPDIIKLDKGLLDEYCCGQTHVFDDILQLCQATNTPAVIEGIERSEQLELMKDLGIHYFQGYYLARPATLLQLNTP